MRMPAMTVGLDRVREQHNQLVVAVRLGGGL